jgi:hypothetical protein
MSSAKAAAAFAVVVAIALFAYFMFITPRIGREVIEQGYRPPIQDQTTPPEIKQPLQKSNVPPPETQKSK